VPKRKKPFGVAVL